MAKNKKGVIYDLDGTIIITTDLHDEGWLEAGRCLNIPIPEEFLLNQKGKTEEAAARELLGKRFDEHGKTMIQIKQAYAINNCATATLFEGFLDTYRKLTENGIKAWICTSASKGFVSSVFKTLPQLQDLANKTVFREMYKEGKPNPEPVLLTAKLMGLPVEECVYVGDAYNDYLAATRAGSEFAYACRSQTDKDPRIPTAIPVISDHTQILSII